MRARYELGNVSSLVSQFGIASQPGAIAITITSYKPTSRINPANFLEACFLVTYVVKLLTRGLLARNNFRFARDSGIIKRAWIGYFVAVLG